jgi:hypothetical protein
MYTEERLSNIEGYVIPKSWGPRVRENHELISMKSFPYRSRVECCQIHFTMPGMALVVQTWYQ